MSGSNPEQPTSATPNYWLATEKTHWLDRLSARVGDWINPIVVKETRQSLKSRQFALTFFLTLTFGLAYSLLAVSASSSGRYPAGNEMIVGYIWILSFPLILAVPFFTFRSMVSEGEDKTYELLAITSLKPRQIIWGKLASGLLQILIYVSAISPCIVFTYMLQEISLFTIFFVILSIVATSVAFCIIGLLLATITQARALQIFLSVIMILGLGWCYYFECLGLAELAERDEMSRVPREGIIALVGIFLVPATYLALFFAAATARLKFPGDNRSTPIRTILVIQQVIGIAWLTWALLVVGERDVLTVGIAVIANHWLFIGAIILGERKEMSERVQRGLPKDSLSQTFLSWFMPGPDRGYLFVLGNLLAVSLFFVGFVWLDSLGYLDWAGGRRRVTSFGPQGAVFPGRTDVNQIAFCVFTWFVYVAAYLTITKIIVELFRKHIPASQTQVFSVCLLVILLGAGGFIPLIIQTTFFYRDYGNNYTVMQFPNMYWTAGEVMDRSFISFRQSSTYLPYKVSIFLMLILTIPLVAFTIIRISTKLKFTPAVIPERIQQVTTEPVSEPEDIDPFA